MKWRASAAFTSSIPARDRLYTLGTNSSLRRSSQTAIHHIFNALVRVLAPIITFTTDEAWAFATTKAEYANDSIHLQDWPVAPTEWINKDLADAFHQLMLGLNVDVKGKLEALRQAGKIGKSLDAVVSLTGPHNDLLMLYASKNSKILPEVLIVSDVTVSIEETPANKLTLEVKPAETLGYHRCPRCWRWVPALEKSPLGDVCPRCIEALKS